MSGRPPGNCGWHGCEEAEPHDHTIGGAVHRFGSLHPDGCSAGVIGCAQPEPHHHLEGGTIAVAAEARWPESHSFGVGSEPWHVQYGRILADAIHPSGVVRLDSRDYPPHYHGVTAQQLRAETLDFEPALFTRDMIERATMPTVQVTDDGTIYFERKGHSVAESALLGRKCRCGVYADRQAEGCLWHPAVSAEYARDLQLWVKAQQAVASATVENAGPLAGIRRATADYFDRIRRVLSRD